MIEKEILSQCIRKYGVGNYKSIHINAHLPHKTTSQLYSQTQRLLGKQSIFEYKDIRLNVKLVRRENISRFGENFMLKKNELFLKLKL